jgi:polysaccharide export outer membrane protein
MALLVADMGHADAPADLRRPEAGYEVTTPSTGQSEQSADEPYRLQRGDEISVRVYGRPELDDTVRVRPDGRISLVLVDEIEAAGLSPAQLDDLVTERYQEFFINPRVTVVVRTIASYKVFVAGEVRTPGPIGLGGDLTALGAVIEAGGFLGTARKDSVILLRKGTDDQPVVTKLNLDEVVQKGAVDVELKPFDVVYVPRSRVANVNKFIDQYIRKMIPITFTFGFNYLLGGRTVVVP